MTAGSPPTALESGSAAGGVAGGGRGVGPFGRRLLAAFPLALALALLLQVARLYALETTAFRRLLGVAVAGFVLQQLVPARARLASLVLLSAASFAVVLSGWSLLWVAAVGLLLVGACRLPWPLPARALILAGLVAGLAAARAGRLAAPWPDELWPVLASVFMFRLAVYAYDQRHARGGPAGAGETLAYFLLPPSAVFAVLPIVDFSTFRRGLRSGAAPGVQERGLLWVTRGLVFLLLHRVLYQFVVLPADDIANAGDLGLFLVSNYALLIRLLGQFDVAIGTLLLLGIDLPETNRVPFLAAGFADFWRRANVYWKDFMLKLFYYPSFFALRRFGDTAALVAAVGLVAVATWLLHAYQWFWIRGDAAFSTQDSLFWAAIGVLLLVNLVLESRRGAEQRPRRARRALQVAATFLTVSALWALWTADSPEQWLGLWQALAEAPGRDPRWLVLLGVLVASVGLGSLSVPAAPNRGPGAASSAPGSARPPAWPQLLALTVGGLLWLATTPALNRRLDPQARRALTALRQETPNRRDAADLARGYYEVLSGRGPELPAWRLENGRRWAALRVPTQDFVGKRLRPNVRLEWMGEPIRTNQWGMLDRDYAKAKPAGTYRMGLCGASHVAGHGVASAEVFENVVEDRLNAPQAGRGRYEILNFSDGGYRSVDCLSRLESDAFAFDIDSFALVLPPSEPEQLVERLLLKARAGYLPPGAEVRQILESARIGRYTPLAWGKRRLRPFKEELFAATLDRIAGACRDRRVKPVFVLLGLPRDRPRADQAERMLRAASQAGFATANLADAYEGQDPGQLVVGLRDYARLGRPLRGPGDPHPNAAGHRRMAEAFYVALLRLDPVLGLGLRPSDAPPPADSGPTGKRSSILRR